MVEKNPIDIYVSHEDGIEVVTVVGPVDSATLEAFRIKVEPVCSKQGARVLLDCKDLTYVNSRAIGLLMKFHRSLMLTRGRFALSSLSHKLLKTLDLLQIGKTLTIFPSRDEALAALQKTT